MGEKLALPLDDHPKAILWLSCREAEDELPIATSQQIIPSSATISSIPSHSTALRQLLEGDNRATSSCVAQDIRRTAAVASALPRADCDTLTGLPTLAQVSEMISRQIAGFDRRQEVAAKHRAQMEDDLCDAIENDELTLYYQPQFDIAGGRACGVEALARWFRADGVVEPSIFIPLAEQTQLIEALGSWVLREACAKVQKWPLLGAGPMRLCINVSPHQLNDAFPSVIQEILGLTGLSAERLELEITESALIGNSDDIIECFRELKSIGVRIAIDDFGTGYSSLSYLSRLPVDRLKLDKSLIHNLTTHWKDVAILRAIIELGKELGIEVIAEGVETERQLEVLKQLGCPQAQGYLLARPAPYTRTLGVLGRRWGTSSTRTASTASSDCGKLNAS